MNIDPTSADSLERMADLIRQQHSSLDTMLLPPTGELPNQDSRARYLDARSDGVPCRKLPASAGGRLPDAFYFACGKARVGSTALSNLFGMIGMPSDDQPLKAILRDALVGHPLTSWQVPSASDEPNIFSKEER